MELLGFDGNEVRPLPLEDIKSYLSSIKEKKIWNFYIISLIFYL
jgi:hypothetical protein